MHIREFTTADEALLAELLIEIWTPFYEESFPSLMDGDLDVIEHQHGGWRDEQREVARTMHNPDERRYLALAVDDDDRPVGVVGWQFGERGHAYVDPLGVSPSARGQGLARALMDHCIRQLKAAGAQYVEIGTGGDDFHAAARHLYESYGLHRIPVAVYLGRL